MGTEDSQVYGVCIMSGDRQDHGVISKGHWALVC